MLEFNRRSLLMYVASIAQQKLRKYRYFKSEKKEKIISNIFCSNENCIRETVTIFDTKSSS